MWQMTGVLAEFERKLIEAGERVDDLAALWNVAPRDTLPGPGRLTAGTCFRVRRKQSVRYTTREMAAKHRWEAYRVFNRHSLVDRWITKPIVKELGSLARGRAEVFLVVLLLAACSGCGLSENKGVISNKASSAPRLYQIEVGGKWGFINKAGQPVINPQFDSERIFTEGLASVELGKKWGFIDTTGRIVVNPQFDYLDALSEGLAQAQLGNKWVYIDRVGRVVFSSPFDVHGDFTDGLASVSLGGKSGFIDKSGRIAITLQFDSSLFGFSEGLAAVKLGER
jgi:hypothetical protein